MARILGRNMPGNVTKPRKFTIKTSESVHVPKKKSNFLQTSKLLIGYNASTCRLMYSHTVMPQRSSKVKYATREF